jgi:ABC-type uncharacterized transport system involved in gliding motility auxiliary subunit
MRGTLNYTLKHGLWFIIAVVLCLGVLRLSSRSYLRVDLSPDQRYTLAHETTMLLEKLTEPLIITALLPLSAPPPYREVAHHTQDLLEELSAAHPSVSLTLIDTAQDRSVSERAQLLKDAEHVDIPITRLSAEREGRQVFIEAPYGVSLAYLNQRTVTPPVELTSEVEYQLASALERLIERRPRSRIGVAQGFGEPDIINSPLARQLGGEGTLVPVRLDGDPLEDEIGTLLILGATRSYGERARWIIDRFRCDGGGVIIALDHRVQSELFTHVWSSRSTGLEPLLRRYGVEVDHRWVIADETHSSPAPLRRDARGHVVATPHPLYPLGQASTHPISAPLRELPVPMSPRFTLPDQAQPLIKAYPQARALRGLKGLNIHEAEATEQSSEGFVLAFALDETVPSCLSTPTDVLDASNASPHRDIHSQSGRREGISPSRLVVIGSGRRLLSADSRGLALMLNALSWVRGEERLLALKMRRPTPTSLHLNAEEQMMLKWITPLLPSVLIALLTMRLRRTSRQKKQEESV